jgi:hypothetical protein
MQDELDNVTTILYLFIETTRHNLETLAITQTELGRLAIDADSHILILIASELESRPRGLPINSYRQVEVG